MQLDTILKAGGLALNVAQDEKVRELFTMVHHGAKRRGLIGPMQIPGSETKQSSAAQGGNKEAQSHPIPFAPQKQSEPQGQGGLDFSKVLTAKNAKKMLGYAGEITQFLMK